MHQVAIQREVPPGGLPSAQSLRGWAGAALGRERGELTIRIVGERESQKLNRTYRGKDKPTNVLSFGYDTVLPADAARGAERVLGDLVICAPVVRREAAQQGKPARAHWAHMVVHGCLHLLGLDHENQDDARRMEAREKKILRSLGFPDPYR